MASVVGCGARNYRRLVGVYARHGVSGGWAALMPLEGMEEVKRNLRRLADEMMERARQAADEIATLLESWAKTNAPFKDRTGNLRQSIAGSWAQVGRDILRVVLSAGMEYAVFVELLHQGRYAYLWPAVAANQERILHIWHTRLKL